MKHIKNILAAIGLLVVLGSLIYAVQEKPTQNQQVLQNHQDSTDKNVTDGYRISAIAIPEDLNFAGEAVPLDDPEILERVDREFLVNTYWQSNALLLMKRANKYFPIIEPILAKNGIPEDFKYLAVAESGLQNVVSPAGATGFWQIMKATGREYGLEVNSNVDERYHVEKATQVACEYLNKWKKRFGTWTMTAAAYNAGPAGIQKYMNIQKADDYYDLLLGQETGRYVFRIMAIKEILSNPAKFGFEIEKEDLYEDVPTFTVEVDKRVESWADFASLYEINYKILKRHNPWLREAHLNNLLVYYLFGQDYRKSKIFERKYVLDNGKIKEWRKKFSLDQDEKEDFKEKFGEGIYKLYKLLRNNENAVLTYNNSLELLVNGEEKFKWLRKDIESAKHHIHLEYFVFVDDALGSEIINLLCQKALQGIEVRLIYDDVGSNLLNRVKKKMTKNGVKHFAFMPVLFSNHTSKINYRNHRKIIVIDGRIGYVGGINIEKKYDNSYDNERFWRDTHIRLEGGSVGSLQSLFLLSWGFVTDDDFKMNDDFFPKHIPETLESKAVQIAASGPDSDWANIMEALFCAITMARERIYITSPYFIPNDAILTALSTASRSGVDVRIIIPYQSDSWAAQYATDSYIEHCLESGIRIFRYHKGFVHAKTMLIDDVFSTIGTANMDYRSFSINFEINALVYDTSTNQQLAAVFDDDLRQSEEVDLKRWRERGIKRKLKESFCRLWAPLL